MFSENVHTKKDVLTSFFWKFLERGGTQGIQFLVQIVLARLLLPGDFGTIAIVAVFISIARVFVESGFSTALIQSKKVDEIDFSSVFYVSLSCSVLLYTLIYITAPYIADFYNDEQLIYVLRVLALILFFGAFNSVQNAYISRNLMFKKLFFTSLGAIILSGSLGIIAANNGLGIWALVIQQLVNHITITVLLMFIVQWYPKLVFSYTRIKVLFSYGGKLLLSQLLNVLYMDVSTLIIGRTYNSSILGYYNRGEQFPKFIVSNIDGSIQSVMLPALSVHQDNTKIVKGMVRRAIMTSSFLVFPMMIGMAVVAEPLVELTLTEKWLPSVPFLQLFCVAYALVPIHTANLQAINALGRSDIFLKLEIIKKTIGTLILIVSLPFGIYAIAFGIIVNGVISSFINAYPNKELLDYSYKEQWLDIMPSLLIALVTGAIVNIFTYITLPLLLVLFFQILSGILIYIALSKLFKIKSYEYLLTTLKNLIKKKDLHN